MFNLDDRSLCEMGSSGSHEIAEKDKDIYDGFKTLLDKYEDTEENSLIRGKIRNMLRVIEQNTPMNPNQHALMGMTLAQAENGDTSTLMICQF